MLFFIILMSKTTSHYKNVTVYTDGACRGNPGPGGYGCVLLCGEQRRELSGGFAETTNNRMEIYGAIRALEHLKYPCNIDLYTDSQYLVNTMTKGWAKRWRDRNWMRTPDERAKNADLWAMLLDLCEKHPTKFIWVKGHASNQENNRCDELAVAAANDAHLAIDEGYEAAKSEVYVSLCPPLKLTADDEPEESAAPVEEKEQGYLQLGF